MSKPGNYTAYQQSTPIQEDFGNNMLQAEDQQFRYREEERRKEQEKYRRKKERQDDFKLDLEKQKIVQTGFEPVDKLNTRLYYQNIDRLVQNHNLLNQDISDEQRQQIIYENAMINKTPEMLQAATGKMTEFVDIAAKGMADGTYSKAVESQLETLRASFEGRVEKLEMENGVPVATVVTKDGKREKINYGEVVNGFKFNPADLTLKVDETEWIKKRVEILGKRQEAAMKNGMAGVEQTFESHRDTVYKNLDKELGTAEEPTDLAISMWVDNMGKELSDFGPEAIPEIKEHLMGKLEVAYDNTFSGSQKREANQYKPSYSQGKYDQEAMNGYDLVYRAARYDDKAWNHLVGRKITVDDNVDKYVGSHKRVGDKMALLDKQGNTIAEIDLSDPERAEAELKPLFMNGDPATVDQKFQHGMSLYGKKTPQVGEPAPIHEVFKRTESISKLASLPKGERNAKVVYKKLQDLFPPDSEGRGVKFEFKDGWGPDNDVRVILPDGETYEDFEIESGDTFPATLDKIKSFIEGNGYGSPEYRQVEGGQDRLGLGL